MNIFVFPKVFAKIFVFANNFHFHEIFCKHIKQNENCHESFCLRVSFSKSYEILSGFDHPVGYLDNNTDASFVLKQDPESLVLIT
jgi:hypothetical protein